MDSFKGSMLFQACLTVTSASLLLQEGYLTTAFFHTLEVVSHRLWLVSSTLLPKKLRSPGNQLHAVFSFLKIDFILPESDFSIRAVTGRLFVSRSYATVTKWGLYLHAKDHFLSALIVLKGN